MQQWRQSGRISLWHQGGEYFLRYKRHKIRKKRLINWDYCVFKDDHSLKTVEWKTLKWKLFVRYNFCTVKIQKYIELLQISKIKTNPVKHYAKDRNRHFTDKEIQMAHKHWKRCSIFLVIRELQIKSPVTFVTHQIGKC